MDSFKLEEAISDYEQAISLGYNRAYFNKGNALVMLGQFNEALECYKFLQQTDDASDAVQSMVSLERMLDQVGQRTFRVDLEKESNYGGLLRVAVYVDGEQDHWNIVFKGREGNVGNFGWGTPGGKGLAGKLGFVVTIEQNGRE